MFQLPLCGCIDIVPLKWPHAWFHFPKVGAGCWGSCLPPTCERCVLPSSVGHKPHILNSIPLLQLLSTRGEHRLWSIYLPLRTSYVQHDTPCTHQMNPTIFNGNPDKTFHRLGVQNYHYYHYCYHRSHHIIKASFENRIKIIDFLHQKNVPTHLHPKSCVLFILQEIHKMPETLSEPPC